MRVLLLHPDDSPLTGPWARQHWDLIIDMGRSSPFSADRWTQHFRCPVLRSDSFRQGIADAHRIREIFSFPRRRLLDEVGIDWWDLLSLLVAPEGFDLLVLQRVSGELRPEYEFWSTRHQGPVRILEALLGRSIQSFGGGVLARSAARAMHYAGLVRRFSPRQLKEIFFDKYDPAYEWRSRATSKPRPCAEPVVLVPSAYGNVSRTAFAFARLLPRQSFLLMATRESAKKIASAPNVDIRDLSAYATRRPLAAEADSLADRWCALKKEFEAVAELRTLESAGVLDPIVGWIRNGLGVRNAWREVLEQEPVQAVLCGDDSNVYTRLPVLLATRRGIPTVDFHHGAIDGRYMLKELPCDLYLAKNEMERDYLVRLCGLPAEKLLLAAPPSIEMLPAHVRVGLREAASAIFFSEPYENAGMRAEEVYAEILPELLRLAVANQRSLVIKLHPFESRDQRRRIVVDILGSQDAKRVNVVDGPLTPELLAQAWFGVTIESTTVIDCLQNGICCFLCGWLSLSPYGYAQQYARFGVGEMLQDASQIAGIAERVERFNKTPRTSASWGKTVDPAMLQEWLTAREGSTVRSAS